MDQPSRKQTLLTMWCHAGRTHTYTESKERRLRILRWSSRATPVSNDGQMISTCLDVAAKFPKEPDKELHLSKVKFLIKYSTLQGLLPNWSQFILELCTTQRYDIIISSPAVTLIQTSDVRHKFSFLLQLSIWHYWLHTWGCTINITASNSC